jgi:hypothetical protein
MVVVSRTNGEVSYVDATKDPSEVGRVETGFHSQELSTRCLSTSVQIRIRA